MADYIRRDDAVCAIREFSKTAVGIATEALVWAENVILDIVPSADVAEVRHGKWELKYEPNGWSEEPCAECSECGEDFILGEMGMDDIRNLFLYCPNCGADMRGGT